MFVYFVGSQCFFTLLLVSIFTLLLFNGYLLCHLCYHFYDDGNEHLMCAVDSSVFSNRSLDHIGVNVFTSMCYPDIMWMIALKTNKYIDN